MNNENLPIGNWHTSGWNGIKVEWKQILKMSPEGAAQKIFNLFLVAKKNFELEIIE